MTIPPFYSVEVITPSGETVETIDNPISLVAARSYATAGSAVLTILPNYDEEFFRYNMRFKLWRTDSVYGKSLFGDTIWFLRKFINNVSQRNYAIEMADALTLLANPVVAYTAQTPYADKTLEELGDITYDDYYRIDNLMKEYVRENFASDALDVARRNPFIVVEQNQNMAPYGEKTAAWAKLDSVLSDLARMSAEKGMELFYDLIPQADNTFLFKVWRDIRGADRGFASSASMIFSDENGDLDDVQVSYDYSRMATYCYVLGYDTGPSQVVVEIGNRDIIESDPFGRIEFTANSTDNDVTSVLLADGQAALYGLRPRRILSAKLSPASSLRYGTDFAYGDRVGVQVAGRKYDCQISAVRAEWRQGRELLDIRLDGSESLWNPTYWEGSDRTPAPIVIPEASYEVPEEPPSGPPPFGDPSIFYGDIQSYVMWDGAHIYRTDDLMEASPIWKLIDTGIDGDILDCQYVYVDADTIGAWLMTTTAIWWCGDIQAAFPSWSEVLTIETVRAADVALVDGLVQFKSMFHYWSAPGHLCVATGPEGDDADNDEYMHAYFWVTEDFGADWTQVDMNYFTYSGGGAERAYAICSLYAINVYRSAPGTIYCIRATSQIGLGSQTRVFLSDDLGYTWTEGAILHTGSNNNNGVFSILNPFPDADDPSYAVMGTVGVSERPDVRVSTDGWATQTELTSNGDPTGYGGLSNLWRVNKRTFDNNHVIGWFRHTATTHMHLLESNDGGATWSLLWNSGLADTTISRTNTGSSTFVAQHNIPNGWPPDIDQWVVIRASDGGFTNVVQLTLDNFGALSDKSGNLPILVSAWREGPADGFALPKMGANAETPVVPDSHILVRVARSGESASATTISLSSADVVEGDRVILHLATPTVDAAPTSIPSGFTLIPNGEVTPNPTIRVYEKVATGAEPANYTFTFSPAVRVGVGLIALYADIAGTVTLDVSANLTTTAETGIFPSVTTTVVNTFLTFHESHASSVTPAARSGMTKQYPGGGGRMSGYTQTTAVANIGPTGVRHIDGVSQTNTKGVTAAWKVV